MKTGCFLFFEKKNCNNKVHTYHYNYNQMILRINYTTAHLEVVFFSQSMMSYTENSLNRLSQIIVSLGWFFSFVFLFSETKQNQTKSNKTTQHNRTIAVKDALDVFVFFLKPEITDTKNKIFAKLRDFIFLFVFCVKKTHKKQKNTI